MRVLSWRGAWWTQTVRFLRACDVGSANRLGRGHRHLGNYMGRHDPSNSERKHERAVARRRSEPRGVALLRGSLYCEGGSAPSRIEEVPRGRHRLGEPCPGADMNIEASCCMRRNQPYSNSPVLSLNSSRSHTRRQSARGRVNRHARGKNMK